MIREAIDIRTRHRQPDDDARLFLARKRRGYV
jgi:hypothetical protein